MIPKLIYLVLLTFVITYAKEEFKIELGSTYGHYCGLKYGSDIGIEPIDSLDRICQIHDICVSAIGYTSCICNEQLYAYATQVYITTKKQQNMRNYILTMIWDSIMPCSNYNGLGKYYFINAKYKGQNYMPFFPYDTQSKYVQITTNYLFDLYLIKRNNYEYFAREAYNGTNQFNMANKVYFQSYEDLIEIPLNMVLVAITQYVNGSRFTVLEVVEIDPATSLDIYILKHMYNTKLNNTKNTIIIVSSIMGVVIIALLVTLVIMSVYIHKKRNFIKGYNIQTDQDSL